MQRPERIASLRSQGRRTIERMAQFYPTKGRANLPQKVEGMDRRQHPEVGRLAK
jgi:hypothetical protein